MKPRRMSNSRMKNPGKKRNPKKKGRVIPFRRKKKVKSRGLRQLEPNILLVGTPLQTRPIEIALADIDAATLTTEWHDQVPNELGEATAAVVLIEPLPGISMIEATKRFVGHQAALFAITGEGLSDSRARRIYDAGATAVFEWPQEAEIFSRLVAEMLAFELVRGRATGPDNALKRTIEAHLKSVTGMGRGIRVTAREGIVSLSGSVDSLRKKAKLEDKISRIPGVKGIVTHNLHVPVSGLADREVVNRVRRVLGSASDIDATTISVAVRNGIATLAGSAVDRSELEHVKELTRTVKGVRGMENLVTISRPQKEKDNKVSRRIRTNLSRMFPLKDVSVSVFDGVAVISGQVDLLKAKSEIEEIVGEDRGVERVINKITVS
jgi:osmotically-inducible protein OsmY